MTQSAAKKGKQILVVDDHHLVRFLLNEALSKRGYDVVTASDGLEAVSKASTDPPDLILMDLNMPVVGGTEAIRALKANPRLSEIPILVVTGYAVSEKLDECKEAGAVDVISKPEFSIGVLMGRIERVLGLVPEPTPEEPSKSVSSKTLDLKMRYVMDLKALPFVAAEIVQLTSHPGANAKDLTETIQRDQALTARLLRLANSAFYALHGRAQNLTQAVARIGFREIRQIALAVTILDELKGKGEKGFLDRQAFWRHCLGTAVLAKEIATLGGRGPEAVEGAFLAGLLHDIGKAFLDDHFHEEYGGTIRAASTENIPLHEAERRTLGMDHTAVAQKILEKWRLPESLAEPIVHHHSSWEGLRRQGVKDLGLVSMVWISNTLVKAACVGSSGNDALDEIPDDLARYLKLDQTRMNQILATLDQQVEELTEILLLHGDGSAMSVPQIQRIDGEIAYVREFPAEVDPVEVLLRRWGNQVVVYHMEGEWQEKAKPEVILLRGFSEAWLSSWIERIGDPVPGRRVGVLVDWDPSKGLAAKLVGQGIRTLRVPLMIPQLGTLVHGTPPTP
jgi:putative nucleotidyltransferase with HDIG domain